MFASAGGSREGHGPDILADPRHLDSALNVLLPTPRGDRHPVAAARRHQRSTASRPRWPAPARPQASPPASPRAASSTREEPLGCGGDRRAMGFPISDPPPAAPVQSGMAAWPYRFRPRPRPGDPLGFPAATAAYMPPPAPPIHPTGDTPTFPGAARRRPSRAQRCSPSEPAPPGRGARRTCGPPQDHTGRCRTPPDRSPRTTARIELVGERPADRSRRPPPQGPALDALIVLPSWSC